VHNIKNVTTKNLVVLRLTIFALALLFALELCAVATEKGFFFIHIADTQLGFTTGNSDLSPEIANFETAIKHINRLKPAFVVVSGDMINTAHDPRQIRAWWRVAREIREDVPVYLVPGNHDLGTSDASDVRSYEKLFGKDHYAFRHDGSYFVVLNSCLIHNLDANADLREAQRKWFEEELAKAKAANAKHIFVLTHHPWFAKDPDEADAYHNIPKAVRQEYLDLMRRFGVDYALAGHLHAEASGRYDCISVITTAALSKRLGSNPEGFRIVKVYPNRVEQAYYALDEVPESVRM